MKKTGLILLLLICMLGCSCEEESDKAQGDADLADLKDELSALKGSAEGQK